MSGGTFIRVVRGIGIALRSAHIGTMALFVGGQAFAVDDASVRPWRALAVLTGAALLASEAARSRHWFYQGRGVITLAHVGALVLVFASPGLARPAIVVSLIIGSVGSHLPGSIRKWSFRHRQVVE
jgi:hypothetical protein